MSNPEFGSRVEFTSRYYREIEYQDGGHIKSWERSKKGGSGLFIGTRTLQNGDCYWTGDDYVFTPEEFFEAALVVPGPRLNPVYVPLDAIQEAS